jgi:hypothetical protein
VYWATETSRVNVEVKRNRLHIVAAVGYFIEDYDARNHEHKIHVSNLLQINQRYFSSKNDSVEVFSAYKQEDNLKVL